MAAASLSICASSAWISVWTAATRDVARATSWRCLTALPALPIAVDPRVMDPSLERPPRSPPRVKAAEFFVILHVDAHDAMLRRRVVGWRAEKQRIMRFP